MLTCKPSRARSVIFDLLRDRQRDVGVKRPPAAYLLPLSPGRKIRRFRLKGSLQQTYTNSIQGKNKNANRHYAGERLIVAADFEPNNQRRLSVIC